MRCYGANFLKVKDLRRDVKESPLEVARCIGIKQTWRRARCANATVTSVMWPGFFRHNVLKVDEAVQHERVARSKNASHEAPYTP